MLPELSPRAKQLAATLTKFVEEECIPNEELFAEQMGVGAQRWKSNPPIREELKAKAKSLGLWNLFIPKDYPESPGLTNYEYAHLCEIMGRSAHIAPTATNCAAPDTGNMEVFIKYGNAAQKKKWLVPLMEGKIRSAFAMTEPAVPSSNATNINCNLKKVDGGYIVNGKKWWISGAAGPNCQVFVVMVRSGKSVEELNNMPGNTGLQEIHKQHSVVIVPMDTPGVKVVRPLTVFGYDDSHHGGHCEVIFNNVFIPTENMVLGEGRGFEIIQGRLGPGRLHHAMRSLGAAERALEIMVARAVNREIQGVALASRGVVLEWIAKSRIEIDSARLLVLSAAHAIDVKGAAKSKKEIAMAKVMVPTITLAVIDRAIQLHGAMGVGQDTPLAEMYANIRTLRIADGPDEVHLEQLGKNEVKQYKARTASKL
ncbi:Acyl-CoA dehydrogenase family member 11 [Smittium culicis]|uniref:Acyl-CoA dehydrogenase family member 11 n=1 Tax=Smittium culicis TaxID=133412 RepID=A0A1R1Y9K5_9FUNG|nr:Acyl-CoA dehydrogenase family member 11 [Smittium culicis]